MQTRLICTGIKYSTLPPSYVRPESERPRLSQASDCENVPLIDLGCGDRALIVQQIGEACRHYGFFQVLNHGVSKVAVQKMHGVTKEFFSLPVEEKLKLYSDDPSKTMKLSTSFNVKKKTVQNWRDYLRLHCYPLEKYAPEWPSNPPPFRATGADVTIDIPEVHNEGDALPMPNVRSRASNSAPGSSSGHSVFTTPQDTPTGIIVDIPNGVHNHGNVLGMPNDWFRASNSSSASSSSHCVFELDGSFSYSIMPSGPHFDQPETSNARATKSHILDDASASEASNAANAWPEILHEFDSEASNGGANTVSEIHDRDIDNDHSARIERPDIRAREKFPIELNFVIVAVTASAVFNLTTGTSTDSPFKRCCATTAGIGFYGSLLAICFARNKKAYKYLSMIGAIGAGSAVNIAWGITVLKGAGWHLNLVATIIACLVSAGVIFKAYM